MVRSPRLSVSTKSSARGAGRPVHRAALAAVAGALLLGAAACSGGASPSSNGDHEVVPVREGGEIVIGAEQEPDCADWLSTCSGSIWGNYMMWSATVPTAFNARQDGDDWVPKPSDLLTGEPTDELVDGKQTITYSINPDATWSDGQPITSADFKYTALQVRDGKDILDRSGYDKIAAIETPDDRTVVLTMATPYASWRALFSNGFGVLPAHLLEGKDRDALMKDGYDWSGGPWVIENWTRGTSVTLVPNDNYWGAKPHLDKVTFQFITDTSAAFQALKSGQVDALYPSPQLDALSQIEAGIPGTRSQVDAKTGNLEAVWLNNAAFPFDSPAVRKAAMYAIDRKAIVARLFGSVGVDEPAQSFFTPILGGFGDRAFAAYSLDLDEVDELMTGDGWAKDSGGFWAKGGKRAAFAVETLAGNKRRDLTLQILQTQFADAGFEMSIHNTTPSELFAKTAPNGDFQAALYTLIDTFPEPLNLSSTFLSANAPSEANGFSGINFGRVDVDGLDAVLEQIDSETDASARVAASKKADQMLADAVPAIPLDVVPNVLLWSERLGGPISINPSEGPFWNLEEWGIAQH
ncbi:ABC transporter substrate-binding protein [Nocardioides sp. SLBN-35]|uniref:ABC transporter substrate-binding protein n=1 Tax=Nocardioides sp. SLBN-35 TaxID=2768445 RepID=UPI00114FDBAB|nr:ABC transporter substrate-binding protein [Nocardioides sp. SLBN-35]TQK68664.1 peptide/nickel transport system substrate-binding protein [Nocardioides sp. SLBN-35]